MNKFDLESRIMELYSIVDALNDISYGIIESDLSKDETNNAVDGLAVITKMKIEKLLDTFTEVYYSDNNGGIGDVAIDYTGCSEPEAYTYSKFCNPEKYTYTTTTEDWL